MYGNPRTLSKGYNLWQANIANYKKIMQTILSTLVLPTSPAAVTVGY